MIFLKNALLKKIYYWNFLCNFHWSVRSSVWPVVRLPINVAYFRKKKISLQNHKHVSFSLILFSLIFESLLRRFRFLCFFSLSLTINGLLVATTMEFQIITVGQKKPVGRSSSSSLSSSSVCHGGSSSIKRLWLNKNKLIRNKSLSDCVLRIENRYLK